MIKRLLYSLISAIFIGLGLVVIIGAGLPNRADFTGYRLPNSARPIAPEINAIAPTFPLLDDYRGQPIILNFWATWCEPCLVEMPDLQRLYDEFGADGLVVLGINLGEAPMIVNEWRKRLNLTFPIGIDDGRVAGLYRLRTQPTTFIISPEGVITHIFHGTIRLDTVRGALAPYLNT
ncbi:MAG: TlpA family protein disulfide reductase [Anaerolineae bacterium]|nr:TlpA family protein disulfide reductase [Anaerolineae bacterium]